jgi:hypothetical protein
MSVYMTKCPRCSRSIELNNGYDGEGGVDYCCEYAFYWRREWTVEITEDNKASYERMLADQSSAAEREGSKDV